MSEIPEYQYAGLGRMVAEFIRTNESSVDIHFEVLDYGRTIVMTSGNLTNEITMRYPVRK